MRKSLALIAFICTQAAAHDVSSHTFFSVRPPFQSASPEFVSLSYDRTNASSAGCGGTVRISFFGGQSTDEHNLAKFFLPYGKTCITAGETGSEIYKDGTADLMSNYFGVATGELVDAQGTWQQDNLVSQSIITMRPRQSTAGIALLYKQRLGSSDEEYDDHGFWFSISSPIMCVKNKLNFTETITTPGNGTTPTGYVSTISEALQGKTVFGDKKFCYGKIPDGQCTTKNNNYCSSTCNTYCCENFCDPTLNRLACNTLCCEGFCNQIKWGWADIEFKLGYMLTRQPDYAVESYVELIIPTGNKPTAHYIFEPIVGNNHHVGAAWGGIYACELKSNDHAAVWLEISGNGKYLFANKQHRSFDLVNKDWSRYIWVYKNDQAEPFYGIEPGINYLTQQARVTPGFAGNATTALMFTNRKFVGEIGYNLHARAAEKVELCCFPTGVGIAGFNFTNVENPLRTQSPATMRLFDAALNDEKLNGDPRFVPLKCCDINLESAAHPSVISHTIYSSIGCRCNEEGSAPVQLAIGNSYEFSDDNTGLNRWLIWGSLTVSF
jgi:hypothetical protein